MELLSGCTLEDKLHEEEILEPAEVISIGPRQIFNRPQHGQSLDFT